MDLLPVYELPLCGRKIILLKKGRVGFWVEKNTLLKALIEAFAFAAFKSVFFSAMAL